MTVAPRARARDAAPVDARRSSSSFATARVARARSKTTRIEWASSRGVSVGRRRVPRAPRGGFEMFPSGPPGGDPSEWTLLTAAAMETIRDAASFAATVVGLGAATSAQRERTCARRNRRDGSLDSSMSSREVGTMGTMEVASVGAVVTVGGGTTGTPAGAAAADGFMWVRGGRNGFKWLGLFLLCAWWCYFIANDPYMGTLWLLCAIACGWGVFFIAGGVFGVGFVANYLLQQYLANTLQTDMESTNDGGLVSKLMNNEREAQMIKSGRYSKTIPEQFPAADQKTPISIQSYPRMSPSSGRTRKSRKSSSNPARRWRRAQGRCVT